MKKELIIQFNIIQHDDIDKQDSDLDFTVYSVNNPDNDDLITSEELQAGGTKKMIKPIVEKRDIDDTVGKTFSAKITKEQLEELFNF